MASQTDVLNYALGRIGAMRITDIDEGSTQANYCKDFWQIELDACLEMAHWNFAGKRVQLALSATPPVFELQNAFELPTDFIKLRQYSSNMGLNLYIDPLVGWMPFARYFRIEGQFLISNDADVFIVYTYRNENPDQWSPNFRRGFSITFAGALASAIAKDEKMSQILRQEGGSILAEAAAVDGQQQSVEPFQVDDLKWGRWGAWGGWGPF